MLKLLKAAFRITPFQIVLIAVFAAIKYFLTTFNILKNSTTPILITGACTIVLFITAVGIKGMIENRGVSFDEWQKQGPKNRTDKLLLAVARLGTVIPAILAFIGIFYLLAPASLGMAIALYTGIVIWNCIDYFSEKKQPIV